MSSLALGPARLHSALGVAASPMSTKRTVALVAGLALTLASAIGHVWHKYFTAVGASRTGDFRQYVSHHWYFWLSFLLGVLLLCFGTRRHPTNGLSQ